MARPEWACSGWTPARPSTTPGVPPSSTCGGSSERTWSDRAMDRKTQMFARKPLALLLEEMKGEDRLRRVLGPVGLSSLGIGAIIGTGIFVLTGGGGPRQGRARLDALIRRRGHRLHLRGALLRRVRLDGPRRRVGLYVCLCDPRRAVRLDHRLGPHPGIHGRLGHGRARLVPLLSRLPQGGSSIWSFPRVGPRRPTTTIRKAPSRRPGRSSTSPPRSSRSRSRRSWSSGSARAPGSTRRW